MKISPSIVRIEKIESPTTLMEFDEVQLEKAAQLILDMEGVVTPLILRRIKPEKEAYTIIEGHFEYYAALRAMEINSRKGKKINAYIVESEEEVPFYQQQIELFRQQKAVSTEKNPSHLVVENHDEEPQQAPAPKRHQKNSIPVVEFNDGPQLSAFLSMLIHEIGEMEGRQTKRIAEISQQQAEQNKKVNEKIDLLQTTISEIVEPPPPPPPPPHPPTSKSDFLTDLNNQQLNNIEFENKLKAAKANVKVINGILSERQKQPFTSLAEVVERTKGLGDKTLIKILDNWS